MSLYIRFLSSLVLEKDSRIQDTIFISFYLKLFDRLIYRNETFEKCSILFKFKEGKDFNRKNTLSILRIKI